MINPTIAQLMRMMRRDRANDCLSDHQLEIIATYSFNDAMVFNRTFEFLMGLIEKRLKYYKLTLDMPVKVH